MAGGKALCRQWRWLQYKKFEEKLWILGSVGVFWGSYVMIIM